ncbi:MAG TPA: RNA polymerase sigma factor [Myxococcaceae bacterium]|jgi:RNA polymerase sigma-70 factor (ECF subfamily)
MSQPVWSKVPVEELIERARGGEKGALEELLRRYEDKLEKWAKQQPEPPRGNGRSDITQASAIRAFEKFSSFKGKSEGELLIWLKRIVTSQAIQMARQALSQKRDDSGTVRLDTDMADAVPASQHSPSHLSAVREETRQLLIDLSSLPEAQGEAISLVFVREFSPEEAARHMGRSKVSVDSLLQRGLKALRTMERGGSTPPEVPSEEAAARTATDAALFAYFRLREEGKKVDPDAFAAEHPECEEELRDLLHQIERLRALKPPEGA